MTLLLPESMRESAHEIVPGVWVGDMRSAEIATRDGFTVLNVLENATNLPEDHIPILVPKLEDTRGGYPSPCAYRSRLLDASNWISINRVVRPVLVHCAAGVERSPLTVAFWITRTTPLKFAEAFAWVKMRRPIAEDRSHWLEAA